MKPAHPKLWLNHNGLQLVFVREIDRWSHHVAAEVEGTLFLSSCEGDANDDWPPSPPLQEVDRHELGDNRQAVLCVGKSGHSHWSASFESRACESRSNHPGQPASSESPWDQGGIRIELACLTEKKSAGPAPQLGSHYRLADQVQGLQTKTGAIRLISGHGSLGQARENFDLMVSPLSGKDWGTQLHLMESELIIRPTRISSEPRKPTRWGYRIGLRQA